MEPWLRDALRRNPAKRERFIDTCLSKVTYWTRDLADAENHRLAERGRHGMEPYRCPVCQWFHLGHHQRKPSWQHRMDSRTQG